MSFAQAWDGVVEVVSSPWVVALAIVLGGFVLGRLLVAIARPALGRLAGRSAAAWDDALVAALATPLSVLLAVQSVGIVLPFLALDPRAIGLVASGVALGTTAAVLWLAFRAIDVARAVLEQRPWAAARPASRSLLAIASRVAKVVVFLFGAIAVLASLGVSVASLIAGLGIGGLALALAAQKTVENLFGTLSIGVDQPLREGDFVRVDDVVGTVEMIGLRSTRIRTLDRTIVTVPNGQLADQRIESFAVRDRLRLACTLGLVYSTTAAQLRRTLAALEETLRAHSKIWAETVVVRFKQLGESSLDIEIMAWFETSDWGEFQLIRQEMLLAFMEVVERNGTSFAFPTQTLHVEAAGPEVRNGNGSGAARPRERSSEA
jgi:MscS family membrane protein